MSSQRSISPFELPFFQVDARFGSVPTGGMPLYIGSTVEGEVNVDVLRAVVRELAGMHPLLRARPEWDHGAVLRVVDGFSPTVTVEEGGEAAYLRLVNEVRDFAQGLFEARVLRDGERTRVVLVLHHGIADGRSGFALLGEMWRRYTARLAGHPLPVPPGELPGAVDERLAEEISAAEVEELLERMRGMIGEPPVRLPVDGAAGDPLGRFAVERIMLDASETADFTAVARAAGISVNSLLSGCAVAAFRAQFDTFEELPMVCGFAADLRSVFAPRIPESTVLNAASGWGTALSVGAASDPIVLGRIVEADVRAAVARRDPARMALVGRHIRDADTAAMVSSQPTFAISNIGRIPRHEMPAGVRALGDHVLAMGPGMPPKLTAFTVGDRLTVQVEYDTAEHSCQQMSGVRRALADSLRRTADRCEGVAAG
ncbi:hypothetical protein [Nocardia sp. NPDC050406]|uniref:phthiocerol/phthiodiolone dimycocerosyl transferase family protein n=1 Tax=Nocardia sp. NPDC050406 TaxID=3364318 RepID=UPI003797CDB3